MRARHTENFAKTFRKLLTAGQAVDTDDMVADALLNGSAEGLYYRIILHAKGEVPLEMIPAPAATPASSSQDVANSGGVSPLSQP